MVALRASDVRKNWSETLDTVIHQRPAYIKRTRDNVMMLNMDTLGTLLSDYVFSAKRYVEPDGSITLSMDELDLVANGGDEAAARAALAEDIMEYAEDYYEDFALWSAAGNRKKHIPYILKALSTTKEALAEDIICRDGRN